MKIFQKTKGRPDKDLELIDGKEPEKKSSLNDNISSYFGEGYNTEDLNVIFEHAPDAYYLYDLKGYFIDGNLMAEKLSGYKREELIGKNFFKLRLLSAGGLIKAAKNLLLNARGKPTGPTVFTFNRKDGSKIDLEIRTHPVKIGGRRLVLGIARDIAARKKIENEIITLNKSLEDKVKQRTEELNQALEKLRSDIKEKAKMEKALQESEARFRHIIDNASDMIYETDRRGNSTYFNPNASVIMKISKEELLGRNYLSLIRKDYRKIAKKFYTKQFRNKVSNTYFEFPAIKGDGSEIWLGQNVQPIIVDGKVKGFQAVARDITQQKVAEFALAESERRYRSIFEESRDVIYVTDTDGHFIEINESGLELFGYTREEIKKITARDLYLNPDDRFKFVHDLESNGFVRDYELKLKKRDGTPIDCLLSATIRPSADGKVLRYQGIIRDITQHKQSEEALLQTERRFRELLENLKMIAILLDLEGNILFCNDYLLEKTGHKKSDVLGKNWFDIFLPEEIRANIKKMFLDNVLAGSIPSHFDNEIITKDGNNLLFSWNNTPLRDSSGKIFGAASIGSDMTDRINAEEQLRHAQRMEVIGNLAGGIAHDFNNALTPILALSQMHFARLEDDDPLKKALNTINKSATRATQLTARLMAFGRKQVLEPHVININTTLLSVGDLLQRSIGDGISIKMRPSSGLWNVKADPIQVEQVLINLVINAKDAIGDKGTITILTENITVSSKQIKAGLALTAGDYVLTSVIDDGPGMTNEIREHIFEPFFTTKDKGHGTGLGLSVVYGIVKQHGGEITCHSVPGKGTTFKIYLPKIDQPVEELKHETIADKDYHGNEVILLVEDDKEVREVLKLILKELGYLIVEASDSAEALKISGKYKDKIHLLLTDLILPGLNGRELSEKLAKKREDMKVLFISGYSDDVIAKHGMIDEGLSFLQKPFTASSLGKKIREVLEN